MFVKVINSSNINGKPYAKLEQKLPLTSSCSSLESTYSSSSASYTYKPKSKNVVSFIFYLFCYSIYILYLLNK